MPLLVVRVAPPSVVVVAAYYGAVSLWWWLWTRAAKSGSAESRRARTARRAVAGVAAFAAVWMCAEPNVWISSHGDGRLHVTFIDVGQGDSALVRFPGGSALLVDAGGLGGGSAFDIGDRVVAPVVRDAGVRRLDVVALTHGDPDHIGGAPAIVRDFRPREVWEGIQVPRSEALAALRLQTAATGGRWANVHAGDQVVIDGVLVTARHPHLEDWERQKVRNDDSLVLELRWRDVSVLLTGDIGKAVEENLTASWPAAPVRILKVPHHGSLTSSSEAFIRAVRPDVAVFSVGRGNRFRHPAPAVVERYRDAGVAMFRTDQDGAVGVDTDGTQVTVHTFTGRTWERKGSGQ
jgi:competence protein ComEC